MSGQFEQLDERRLMSVSMSADGWTNITPSSDSRMIYVSSSAGSDSNPGTLTKPLKSLAKAKTLVRDLKPDWVLLKRGDTWHESFPDWVFSGRSAQEPSVITAYGSGARPTILTGAAGGITLAQKYSNPLNHVAVTGLHFFANTYDGKNGTFKTAGIRVMCKGTDVLLEDNYIQGYKDNVVVDPAAPLTNVRIRRNVIVDAWNTQTVGNGYAQGIYGGANAIGTLIEGNVLDHNGWKEGVAKAGPTMFNHSIYFQVGSKGLVVKDNVIARGALHGLLARGGATVTNNVFVRNPIAIEVGNVNSTIENNVILEGNDLPGQQQLGKGIQAFNMSKLIVRKNVFAHDISAGKYNNFALYNNANVYGGELRNNIVYDWQNSFKNASKFVQSANQVTTSGSLPGSYKYASPNRSVGTYNASLGRSNSIISFLSYARAQSRSAWDVRYSANTVGNYIRAGFNLTSSTLSVSTKSVTTSSLKAVAPVSSSIFSDSKISDRELLTV